MFGCRQLRGCLTVSWIGLLAAGACLCATEPCEPSAIEFRKFDVRLEGMVLFDYGDGLYRNDVAAHVFYDDVTIAWCGGRRWCLSGSAARKMAVYAYPLLEERGELRLDCQGPDATSAAK